MKRVCVRCPASSLATSAVDFATCFVFGMLDSTIRQIVRYAQQMRLRDDDTEVSSDTRLG